SLTLSHPGLRFHQAPDGVRLRPLAQQRDGLRDELLRQSQGELVSETPITLAGEHPGREVRVRRTGEARVLLRFDVVGRRADGVSVAAPEDRIDGPNARRFLDSFQVLAVE